MRRLGIPPLVWQRMGPGDGGPPRRRAWWETSTPLATDCDIALEKLHCTPGELYRRTTWQERLLLRIHLAYRAEQEQAAAEYREMQREEQAEAARRGGARH